MSRKTFFAICFLVIVTGVVVLALIIQQGSREYVAPMQTEFRLTKDALGIK